MAAPTAKWQAIAAQATQKVLDDIPAEWRIPQDKLPPAEQQDVTDFPRTSGLFTAEELAITETLASDLVAKLAKGEYTAEAVTRAFCKRAAAAHQLTNCLTVIMFNDAIARAKQLDEEFKKTGRVTGPLHGLPMSIKDNFNIPGYPSSVGFCNWALDPMEAESTIVTTLKSLGAIPFVKTNVPTAMMIAETVNNCYGRTVNPHNRATTSGGSSGGESALIAFKGSPLGVGTDIGGSLRIPASCVGIFTLKPSAGRFPQFDARSGLAGQEAVASVHGPMAHSIADLRLYAEHVVGSQPWLQDPKCIEIPWRTPQIADKPTIAVLWHNGIVHPTPAVHRALTETVAKLKAKGYNIVDWPVDDDIGEGLQLLGRFFLADGGKSVAATLAPVDEPLRPEMAPYGNMPELGVHDLWQLQAQRTALQKRFLARWQAIPRLDAILGPTTPYPGAPNNGTFKFVGYTGIFNLLDYASLSFPTGIKVDREKDVYPADWTSFGTVGEGPFAADVDSITRQEYDPATAHGLEVSLQLTGKRLEEEKVLALGERILADLKA